MPIHLGEAPEVFLPPRNLGSGTVCLWVTMLPFPQPKALGLAVILLLALPVSLEAQGPLQHWRSFTKPLPHPQAFAAGVAFQGRFWLVGGEASSKALSRVQILDPKAPVWTAGPSLPASRTRASAAGIGTRLFVAGGRVSGVPVTSLLELVQGKWKKGPAMKVARSSHALVADTRSLFVLGGRSGSGLTAQRSCERFDLVKGAWSSIPDMPGPRFGHAVHLSGGKLYVFGGFSSSEANPLRSTWIYDIAKKVWILGASLSDQIRFHGYGTSYVDFSGERLLLGGQGSTSPETSGTACERLDLASGSPRWFACTPSHLVVLGASAATIAGRTFLAGGGHASQGGILGSTRVQELQNIVLTRKSVPAGKGFPYPVEVVHPPLLKGQKIPVLIFEPGLSEKPSYYKQFQDQLAALGFFVMSHDTSLFLDPAIFAKVQLQAAQEITKSPVYGPFVEDRFVFGGFSAGGGGAIISAGSSSKTAAVFALAPWAGCAPSTTRCGTKSPVIVKAASVRAPAFLMANQGDALGTRANTDWILESLVNAARFRVSYVLVDKDHGGRNTGQGFADTHAKTLPQGRALQERLFRYVLSFLQATVLESPIDAGPLVLDRSGEPYARWIGDGPRKDPAIQTTRRFVRRPELYLRLPAGLHMGAALQIGILGTPATPSLILLSGGKVSKLALGTLGTFLLDLQTLIVVPAQLPTSGLLELGLSIPAGLTGPLHFQVLGLDDAKPAGLHLSGWRRSQSF